MSALNVYRVLSLQSPLWCGMTVVAYSTEDATTQAGRILRVSNFGLKSVLLHRATKEEIMQACLERLVK